MTKTRIEGTMRLVLMYRQMAVRWCLLERKEECWCCPDIPKQGQDYVPQCHPTFDSQFWFAALHHRTFAFCSRLSRNFKT